MISIIQMNIYIKPPRRFARAILLPLLFELYQRYWSTRPPRRAFSPSQGIPSRFSMSTPIRLFTRLVRSLILRGGRESSEPEKEPNGTWMSRARGTAFGRKENIGNLLFFSRPKPTAMYLLSVCDADTYEHSGVASYSFVETNEEVERHGKDSTNKKLITESSRAKKPHQDSFLIHESLRLSNAFLFLTFDDRTVSPNSMPIPFNPANNVASCRVRMQIIAPDRQ